MNMARIEIRPYALPLSVPYRWSKGVQHERCGVIVGIALDGGIGWGEAALPPHVIYPGAAFADQCRALLHGLDPERDDFLDQLELREVPARIRCGISSAWLSARAARDGKSLAAYVGGSARRIATRVPVNDLIGDEKPETCVERAAAAAARGQDTVKIKCDADRALDLARVGAIREAFPNLRIRLDPNESWPLSWALEQLRAMARFDIEYVEEPLPRGTTLASYAELCRASPIPIALDDSARTLTHVQSIIAQRAAHVLILKPPRLGGPDRIVEVIDAAAAAGLRSVVTASLETAIGLTVALHCGAALPEPIPPCGIGTARFLARDLATPPPIRNGFMTVPDAPGLGITPFESLAPAA
jgi:o-succinylbenzoate synthase